MQNDVHITEDHLEETNYGVSRQHCALNKLWQTNYDQFQETRSGHHAQNLGHK